MAADNAETSQNIRKKRRFSFSSSDTIAGQVGDNASNVVVGKNVIQIGRLNIPIWLMVLFAVVLAAVLGLLVFVNSDELLDRFGLTPVAMPGGVYGVAVAPFYAPDVDDAEIKREGAEKATSLGHYLSTSEDVFVNSGEAATVYGPEQRIQATSAAAVAAYATAIKADLVIYGELKRISALRWELIPRFYLGETAMKRAPELSGDAALGAPITYRTDAQQAGQREVNRSLQDRVRTIVDISIALSYLDQETLSSYEDAVALLMPLEKDSAWTPANRDLPGQEILYAYAGIAFLKLADAISELDPDGFASAATHLDAAEHLLLASEGINPSYPRVLVGLGNVYYQKGRQLRSGACGPAAVPYLDKAKQKYSAGVQEIRRTVGAGSMQLGDRSVYLNALLGLARVDLYKFYCDRLAGRHHRLVEDALANYTAVIDEYDQAPNLLLAPGVFHAHLESAQILRDALAYLVPLSLYTQPGVQIKLHLEQADTLARELDKDGLNKLLESANSRVCKDLNTLVPIAPELGTLTAYCEEVQVIH